MIVSYIVFAIFLIYPTLKMYDWYLKKNSYYKNNFNF